MMISLDDIRAFVSVARHESFVTAADELHITPPALSRRIKKLEEFVGERLFDRTTQMVSITRSGEALLDRAEAIVRDFESFKDFAGRFTHHHAVKVRFACMWSTAGAIVPKVIRDYTRLRDDAEFEVQDADANSVNRLVRERQADFGISMRPRAEEGLEFKRLCSDPVILACPPGHRFFDRENVSWAELDDPSLKRIDWGVMRSIDVGTLRDEIRRLPTPIPDGAPIVHLATQLGFLEAHQTAIVLPLLGACLARAPEIRSIPIVEPELHREIGIVSLPGVSAPRFGRQFRTYLEETFQDHYRSAVSRFADGSQVQIL